MAIFFYSSLFYSLVFLYFILNHIKILNFKVLSFICFILFIINIKLVNDCSLIEQILSIFGIPSFTSFSYFVLLVLSQLGINTWLLGVKERLFMMIILSLFYMNYCGFLGGNVFYLSYNQIGLICLMLTLVTFFMNQVLGFMFLMIIIFHLMFLPASYNLFLSFFDPLLLIWIFLKPRKINLNKMLPIFIR